MDESGLAAAAAFVDELIELGLVRTIEKGMEVLCNAPLELILVSCPLVMMLILLWSSLNARPRPNGERLLLAASCQCCLGPQVRFSFSSEPLVETRSKGLWFPGRQPPDLLQ